MPFRLDPVEFPNRTKIQFTTSAEMPHLIYRACLVTGILSNTHYCQLALAHALARDLGVPVDPIIDALPAPRGPAAHLYDPGGNHPMSRYPRPAVAWDQTGGVLHTGPANTIEEVREHRPQTPQETR